MLLVIDVGNTNTSLGVYEHPTRAARAGTPPQATELVAHWRLTTARNRE